MSCYILNKKEVYFLALFFEDFNKEDLIYRNSIFGKSIYNELMEENINSFRYKYGGRFLEDEGFYHISSAEKLDVEKLYQYYKTKYDKVSFHNIVYSVLSCYMYQSCDHDKWQESLAYKICKKCQNSLNRLICPKNFWGLEYKGFDELSKSLEVK